MTAVAPVVVKCRGLWVGWPGLFLDDPLEPIPEAEDDSSAAAGLLSNQVIHGRVRKFDFVTHRTEFMNAPRDSITRHSNRKELGFLVVESRGAFVNSLAQRREFTNAPLKMWSWRKYGRC